MSAGYREAAFKLKGAYMAIMMRTGVDYQIRLLKAEKDEPGEEWEILAEHIARKRAGAFAEMLAAAKPGPKLV